MRSPTVAWWSGGNSPESCSTCYIASKEGSIASQKTKRNLTTKLPNVAKTSLTAHFFISGHFCIERNCNRSACTSTTSFCSSPGALSCYASSGQSSLTSTSLPSSSSSSSDLASSTPAAMRALRRKLSSMHPPLQAKEIRHLPTKDSQNQIIPEEIKRLKDNEWEDNLVLHPPDEPHSVLWGPSFRGFAVGLFINNE